MVVQAESLMMAKEHFIEAYGPVRYTLSIGGSGASHRAALERQCLSGIYDGLIVEASFPDAWTPLENTEDCVSLVNYWTDPTRWAPGSGVEPGRSELRGNGDAASSCAVWVRVSRRCSPPADETGQVPPARLRSASDPTHGSRVGRLRTRAQLGRGT